MRTCCFALCILLTTIEARAQALITSASDDVPSGVASSSNAAPSSPVFRTGVDVVALNVVVTDTKHRFVGGLSSTDFAVYEDGVQQEVSFFAATHVPLDLALLLDTSASMQDKMQTMQDAAVGFTSTVRAGDRVTIVEIKDTVRVLHPLDDQVTAATAAIRGTVARGGTALYNALYTTLKELVRQRKTAGDVRRQAVAVFSDGEDTTSLVGYDDVMEVAKQAGISIYTIALKSPFMIRQASLTGRRYFSQSEYAMKSLAQETGARAFFPTDITELSGVYASIADELANQYAIGYTSKNPRRDGRFRRVIVQIAQRPEVQTRTRTGYLAARLEQTTR